MSKIDTISSIRDVKHMKNHNSKSSQFVGVTSEFRAKWVIDNDIEIDPRNDLLPKDIDNELSIAYLLYKISLMST
jgi:hypothetical protein